jgi:hypothetical protein
VLKDPPSNDRPPQSPNDLVTEQSSAEWSGLSCHVTEAHGKRAVRQGGPLRLWDTIESAYLRWQQLGQPGRSRFGLTVNQEQDTIWLDDPNGPY